jgi:hypothetical protein
MHAFVSSRYIELLSGLDLELLRPLERIAYPPADDLVEELVRPTIRYLTFDELSQVRGDTLLASLCPSTDLFRKLIGEV